MCILPTRGIKNVSIKNKYQGGRFKPIYTVAGHGGSIGGCDHSGGDNWAQMVSHAAQLVFGGIAASLSGPWAPLPGAPNGRVAP